VTLASADAAEIASRFLSARRSAAELHLGPIAVVSDFGNNNGLVIGAAIPDWRTSGFEEWNVTTSIDGYEVGDGRASAFPDGAI
jgi:2-keto-4-pentenoate hydratase